MGQIADLVISSKRTGTHHSDLAAGNCISAHYALVPLVTRESEQDLSRPTPTSATDRGTHLYAHGMMRNCLRLPGTSSYLITLCHRDLEGSTNKLKSKSYRSHRDEGP